MRITEKHGCILQHNLRSIKDTQHNKIYETPKYTEQNLSKLVEFYGQNL